MGLQKWTVQVKRGIAVMLCAILSVTGALAVAARGNPMVYPSYPYHATEYKEDYRNQFHFSTQTGWQFDVNGLVYLDGEYHLFYQHWLDDPLALQGRSYIGHAVSRDLLHWTQLPVSTQPGIFPGEQNFSGTTIVDHDNVSGFKSGGNEGAEVMITYYSAVGYGIAMAYSNDRGRTWTNYEGNPIVYNVPEDKYYPRDPKVFYYKPTNTWIMILYEAGSTFYTSQNLRDWTKASNIDFGHECPDMFEIAVDGDPLNTKWVLQDASGSYLIGDFNGEVFKPDSLDVQKMDKGPSYYAAQTFVNLPKTDGRVIQIAWMHHWTQSEMPTDGWKNGATFPVELKLVTGLDGKLALTRTPIQEIESLYATSKVFTPRIYNEQEKPLRGIESNRLDVRLKVDLDGTDADSFGIRFSNYTVLYDSKTKTINGVPVEPVNGAIEMRFLRDAGSMEIFMNGGLATFAIEVPYDLTDNSVELIMNGNLNVQELEAHTINRTWDESSHDYPLAQTDVKSNLAGPWSEEWTGYWNPTINGVQGVSTGSDAFYIYRGAEVDSSQDFVYEADIRVSQGLGGLVFRAQNDLSSFYVANIQRVADNGGMANKLRLWRKNPDGGWKDLVVYSMPQDEVRPGNNGKVIEGKSYHVKVVATGSNIKMYLGSELIADVTDNDPEAAKGSLIAFNVWGNNNIYTELPGGIVNFDNILYRQPGLNDDNAGEWLEREGIWEKGLEGLSTTPLEGDEAIAVLDRMQPLDNFVFEATLSHEDASEGGILFRSDGRGGGYKVMIDRSEGKVRLYAGNRLLSEYSIYLDFTLTSQLKIVAYNERIQVYLNRQKAFDLTDSSYAAGELALVAKSGHAVFSGIAIRPPGTDTSLARLYAYDRSIPLTGNAITVDVPANTLPQFMPQISAHSTDPKANVLVQQAAIGFDSQALVSVTAESGAQTEYYVVSFRASIPEGELKVAHMPELLQKGSGYRLETNLPERYAAALDWTSDNPVVASVDANGVVEAISEGEALISAQIGSYSFSRTLHVKDTLSNAGSIVAPDLVLIRNSAGDAFAMPLEAALRRSGGTGLDALAYTATPEGLAVTAGAGQKEMLLFQRRTGRYMALEADVTLSGPGNGAVGLIVGSDTHADSGYTALLDASDGYIRLRGPDGVAILEAGEAISVNRSYHLKLELTESEAVLYVDGNLKGKAAFSAGAAVAEGGYAGVIVENGTAKLSNVALTGTEPLISNAHVLDIETANFQNKVLAIALPKAIRFVPELVIAPGSALRYEIAYPQAVPGTYGIKADDPSGLVTSFVMNVSQSSENVPAEQLILVDSELSIEPGQSVKAGYQIFPAVAAYNSVNWSSADEKVATVNSQGIVTGVGYGRTLITAEVNGIEQVIDVHVIDYFVTNMGNPRIIGEGDWTETPNGLVGQGEAEHAYLFLSGQHDNFVLTGEVKLEAGEWAGQANAASLLFRSDEEGKQGYSFTLQRNANGTTVAKLLRLPHHSAADDLYIGRLNGFDASVTQQVKIVAHRSKIQIYLNDTSLKTVYDNQYSSGYSGLSLYNAKAVFQRVLTRDAEVVVEGSHAAILGEPLVLTASVHNGEGVQAPIVWSIKGANAKEGQIEGHTFVFNQTGQYRIIATADDVSSAEFIISVRQKDETVPTEPTGPTNPTIPSEPVLPPETTEGTEGSDPLGTITREGNRAILTIATDKWPSFIQNRKTVDLELDSMGPAAEREVGMAIEAWQSLQNAEQNLILRFGDMRLLVPYDAFLISPTAGDKEIIRIIISKLDKVAEGNAGMKPLSDAYQISVLIGKRPMTLAKPLEAEIKLQVFNDTRKVGAYNFDSAKGLWKYTAGRIDTERSLAIFHVPDAHESIYAVFINDKTFTDVPASHWAYDAIGVLAARGIVNGRGELRFAPKASVTRAEFAAMAVRLLSLPVVSNEGKYGDVKDGSWYADIIATAAKHGIMEGNNGEIRPLDVITREEMAVIIKNVLSGLASGKKAPATRVVVFADDSAIAPWAQEAVATASKFGIINGKPGNLFAPKAEVTRAEAALVMYRLLEWQERL